LKILITGASSGIGEELARQYAKPDNELILLARREERLLALQSELLPHPKSTSSLPLTAHAKSVAIIVSDVTQFENLQEHIKGIGHVDMVILNAGISLGHSSQITPFKEFKRLYDVNVLANHAILEILLPHFVAQKSGKIVFISSLASLISMPSAKAYSSSKRALNAYAEGIRYKYKNDGIKVINILPGFIKSELTDKNSFHMPFLLSTVKGAKRIVNAIEKEKRMYAFPLRFYLIISLLNLLPQLLRDKIVNSIN
jgi:short-subunit dehydrogenase